MFKISTKGDYGLLFLSTLAKKMNEGRGFVSLTEIAEEKHLSLKYLSQIVLQLKQAGLIKSKEGREGGYALTKPASEITMMEILEVLEGKVAPVRCCERGENKCGAEEHCNIKSTWTEAASLVQNFLKTQTLQDTLK